jgi:nitrite reductase (NADH) large subunit
LYEVLTGKERAEEIISYGQEWYSKFGVKVELEKKIVKIDVANKIIVDDSGLKTGYDKLLLANGAQAFVPPIKGVEKRGCFTLRTLDDAVTIRRYAENRRKAIVIGGGLLGLEFAACLRRLGQQVTVVEIRSRLLPTQLDEEASKLLEGALRELGLNVILGVKTTEIFGKEAVAGVILDNGKEVSGELILISAGIKPNFQLAADAGIRVNKGVIVDERMRTSINDVYGAGDVIEFKGQVYGIIPPAVDQAHVASANMLGEETVYKGAVPSTTLKISGISLTSVGLVNPQEPKYEEIRKLDKQEGVYKKIVLDQGRIVGTILLGERKETQGLMKLMEKGTDVTKYKNRLLEDHFDFSQIK